MTEEKNTLFLVKMICNTAIDIANAWIKHSVLRHNANAGSGNPSFLSWPEDIKKYEE